MAYQLDGLRKIAHGGVLDALLTKTGDEVTNWSQKSIWHYVTNDADTVVEANAYFDDSGISKGDIIVCSLDIDGTPEVKIYIATGTIQDVGLTAMLIA